MIALSNDNLQKINIPMLTYKDMLKELTRCNQIKLIYIIKHKGIFAFDKTVFCVVILSNDLLIGPDSKKSMRPESYFECNYFDSYITSQDRNSNQINPSILSVHKVAWII